MKISKKLTVLLVTVVPSVTLLYAQTAQTILAGETVFQNVITNIFNPIYKIAVGIAFIYFMFGVFMFVKDLNDPEKKNVGKKHLLWGTVGLFIIVSVGGILPLLNSVLGGMFTY